MDDRTSTLQGLADRAIPADRLDALEEGILVAINGPFYALQVAIGQDDGGIASLYASGTEGEVARGIAAGLVAAGWDGVAVPAWVDEDNRTLLPHGETHAPGDVPGPILDIAVADFLDSVARQAGVDPKAAFDANLTESVAQYFRSYLDYEGSYRMAP